MCSYLSQYYVKPGFLYSLTVSLMMPCVVLGFSARLNEFFLPKNSLVFSLRYTFSHAFHTSTWNYRGFFSLKCYKLFYIIKNVSVFRQKIYITRIVETTFCCPEDSSGQKIFQNNFFQFFGFWEKKCPSFAQTFPAKLLEAAIYVRRRTLWTKFFSCED